MFVVATKNNLLKCEGVKPDMLEFVNLKHVKQFFFI